MLDNNGNTVTWVNSGVAAADVANGVGACVTCLAGVLVANIWSGVGVGAGSTSGELVGTVIGVAVATAVSLAAGPPQATATTTTVTARNHLTGPA